MLFTEPRGLPEMFSARQVSRTADVAGETIRSGLQRLAMALLAVLVMGGAHAFEGFDSEGSAIASEGSCHSTNLTPGTGPWGDLFACIGGAAETVKVFVNGQPGSGRVENVKIMWNDNTRDVGYRDTSSACS